MQWTTDRIGGAEPGSGVTRHRLDSGRPGPRLLVLGGVHGNEIGGIVGAGRLTATDWPLIAGRLDVVPITHEAAHREFVRTGPVDGRDLARTFPGDPDREPTQRLAALVADQLISDCDGLIDLHTSAVDADLPFFAGSLDDGTPYGDSCHQLAINFGLSTVWSHPDTGPGRTLTSAMAQGIPAMYVESPTGGVLDAHVLSAYTGGVLRVAEAWQMLPPGTAPAPEPLRRWLTGNGNTDTFVTATTDGFWVAEVELLDSVHRGEVVGRVIDHLGATRSAVTAADDGTVVFLRRLAPVTVGTPLVSVGNERTIPSPAAPSPELPSPELPSPEMTSPEMTSPVEESRRSQNPQDQQNVHSKGEPR